MSDLFKKLNTLLRASIDSALDADNLRRTIRRDRSQPVDPASKEAGRAVARLRQQVDEALRYEDTLQEQIDALRQEASDLDTHANLALKEGQEDEARRTLEQLRRTEQRITMLEADMAHHRQKTATLMDEVNTLDSLMAEAKAATAAETEATETAIPVNNTADPASHTAAPATDSVPEESSESINIPVIVHLDTEPPPDAGGTPQEAPPPAVEDDEQLAARRARLAKRPPNNEE